MIKILSSRRVIARIWYVDSERWQSAAMTLLIRRRRPPGERSLAFHPCIFHCTFSTRGSNAWALDLSSCIGKPKYFLKEWLTFIMNMDCIILQWCSCALGESIMNDLCILMISPMLDKTRWCIGLWCGIVVDTLLWKKKNSIISEKEVVDRWGSTRYFKVKTCVLLSGLY